MQQTLTFFDTMLSHDHPAYLGILRLAYEAAKIGNDKALVRLTIVAVTFLPITIFTGECSPYNAEDSSLIPCCQALSL
jgi:Mg2+ and Co2+ transporter CorA